MSGLNQQRVLMINNMCHFCLLQIEKCALYRIPWYEWQDSALAAMYESVMKHQLPHLGVEVCYCNNCSELLCQTFMALQMFQRSETYWGNTQNAPVSPNCDDHCDVEYLDDNIIEIPTIDKKDVASFNWETVKIELGSVKMELTDYEEPYIDVVKKLEVINTDATEEDLGHNDSNLASNASTNEKTVKNEAVREKVSMNIKQVKPSKNIGSDKLHCAVCNEIFSNKTSLNRHTDATHNMVQCIRCTFTTTTRKLLQRHELVEHKRSIDSISPCPKCKKIYTDPFQLRMHDRKAHAPIVLSQCHICSKIFSNGYRLKNHMNHIHVEARFECDICTRKFRQKKYLKLHMETVHIREANFICTSCGKTFTNQVAWKVHQSKSCQIYNSSYRARLPNPKYACSLCHVKFSDIPYGRIHYQKMHQIKDVSLVCPICNYLSSSQDDLSAHMSATHLELACPICKRFLKSQITLKNHIASHSTKERLFECKICKATFVKAIHLSGHHKRIHLGERPHKCTDCDLRFAENCEMLAHRRHKHDLNRKFKCEWCGKGYVSMSALRLHEAVHTGIGRYDCELCNKNFRLVLQLSKHFEKEHPHAILSSQATIS